MDKANLFMGPPLLPFIPCLFLALISQRSFISIATVFSFRLVNTVFAPITEFLQVAGGTGAFSAKFSAVGGCAGIRNFTCFTDFF